MNNTELRSFLREARSRRPELTILENEPMSRHCSFRIGGACDAMLLPSSIEDVEAVCALLAECGEKPFLMGNGTNLLVTDAPLHRIVLRMGEDFSRIDPVNGTALRAESGATLSRLALFAAARGLAGLEFAHGIPGTLGGAVSMNAGAYGGEMKDVVTSVTYLDKDLSLRETDDAGFSYRHSRLEEEAAIVISADFALEPKPKAYYMRSFFKPEEPVVHIAVTESKGNVMWNGVQTGNDGQSDHWNRTPGTKLSLTTYTNADEVELLVNGKSYGIKKNDKANPKMRNQIRWENVVYQDGNCEAIARTNGKVVARHKIVTVGKAVALKAVADNSDWKADGMDLQHIRIIAVDSKGRRVPNAVAEVKVNVVGDAQLVAMSNGNINSDELNVTDHQSLFNGSCLAILRSGVASSPVIVNISAPGLKAAKLKLATK